MRKPLTATETSIGRDLGKHAASRMVQAFDDVAVLCSRREQRGAIALHCLATMFGLAAAEIDKAEGRTPPPGDISPEAHTLILALLHQWAPPALAEQEKGDA